MSVAGQRAGTGLARVDALAALAAPTITDYCQASAQYVREAIAVVVFDRQTGLLDPGLPPAGSGLRWPEFVSAIHDAYQARFGEP